MANKEDEQTSEIDFVRTLLKLWSRRKWLAAGTGFVVFLSILYAFLSTPLYRSDATISLRESADGKFASLAMSQFGGAGGMIASHLGMGTNALDKVELVLKSWGFLDDLVSKNNLLPRLFPELWDETRKTWADPDEIPLVRHGSGRLRGEYVTIRLDPKRSLIDILAFTPDPMLSKELVEMYLAELNERIRTDVVESAEANQAFLEDQLDRAYDPVVREKIQRMIGAEIEKAMLVSSSSFDVVIKPLQPYRPVFPQHFNIIAKAFIFGVFLSIAGSFAWDGLAWLRVRIRAEKLKSASTR